MKTKELYVLVSDGGDGSFYPHYTFNKDWIKSMEEKSERGEIDYDTIGCDGDGFHYDTLTVPETCTLESLGISYDVAKDD